MSWIIKTIAEKYKLPVLLTHNFKHKSKNGDKNFRYYKCDGCGYWMWFDKKLKPEEFSDMPTHEQIIMHKMLSND